MMLHSLKLLFYWLSSLSIYKCVKFVKFPIYGELFNSTLSFIYCFRTKTVHMILRTFLHTRAHIYRVSTKEVYRGEKYVLFITTLLNMLEKVLPVNPQDSPDIPERLAPSDSELQSEALAKPGPSNASNLVANGNPRTATPAPDKLKPRKRGSETPTAVSRKEFSVTPYNWQWVHKSLFKMNLKRHVQWHILLPNGINWLLISGSFMPPKFPEWIHLAVLPNSIAAGHYFHKGRGDFLDGNRQNAWQGSNSQKMPYWCFYWTY